MKDELLTFYDNFNDWLRKEYDRLDIDHYPQSIRESTFRDLYPTMDDLYSSYQDYKFGDHYIVEVTYRDRLNGDIWSEDELVRALNPSRAKEQVIILSYKLYLTEVIRMEVLGNDDVPVSK